MLHFTNSYFLPRMQHWNLSIKHKRNLIKREKIFSKIKEIGKFKEKLAKGKLVKHRILFVTHKTILVKHKKRLAMTMYITCFGKLHALKSLSHVTSTH